MESLAFARYAKYDDYYTILVKVLTRNCLLGMLNMMITIQMIQNMLEEMSLLGMLNMMITILSHHLTLRLSGLLGMLNMMITILNVV